jgi:hypothetical protein
MAGAVSQVGLVLPLSKYRVDAGRHHSAPTCKREGSIA